MNQQGSGGRGPLRFSSSLFYPKGCFADASDSSQDNFDDLYCTGNTMVMVLSFVNSLIFCLLLVIHIKDKRRKQTCGEVLLKVKTMILILIIIL